MAQNTGSVTTSNGNVRSVRLTDTVSGGTVAWTVEIYSKYALRPAKIYRLMEVLS